jgi:hypothetical protein
MVEPDQGNRPLAAVLEWFAGRWRSLREGRALMRD